MPNCDDILEGFTPSQKKLIKKRADVISNKHGLDSAEAIKTEATKLATDIKKMALIQKRNAILNSIKTKELTDYVVNNWNNDWAEGFKAFLVGSEVNRHGSRNHVGASQDSLMNRYIQGFTSELENKGVFKILTRGDEDKEVWHYMFNMDENGKVNNDSLKLEVSDNARIIAETIFKYNEMIRKEANQAGAFIGQLDGYIVNQSHDMAKIYKAGEEKWTKYMNEHLDINKSFPYLNPEEINKALKDMYLLFSSGKDTKFKEAETSFGFKGFGNVGKKVSKSRVLHFKDSDSAYNYNREFGRGSLRESLISGFERNAQNTGIMKRMGPNAEQTLDKAISNIQHTIKNADQLKAFDTQIKGIKARMWPQISGEANIPGSHMAADINRVIRMTESMAYLGGAVLSAVGDVPIAFSELRYQGFDILTAWKTTLVDQFIPQGKVKNRENKELAGMLGILHSGMKSTTAGRFTGMDSSVGKVSRANGLYFKLNGLQWWTDKMRMRVANAMASRLTTNKDVSFGSLSPELTNIFNRFDIGKVEWDLYRQTKSIDFDSYKVQTPEGILDLPDSAFKSYLSNKGIKANEKTIGNVKQEVIDKFRNYFFDRSTTAVLEPNQRTRSTLLRSTNPGTVEGEFARHATLFKSFPMAILQRVMAREIYGRLPANYDKTTAGMSGFTNAMRDGKGSIIGPVKLMVLNSMFGAGALWLKDIAKGRTPRVPTDERGYTRFALDALLQGGMLGLLGDSILGEQEKKFGSNFASNMLGPSFNNVSDIADILSKARDGKTENLNKQAIKLLIKNTPGNNIFYLRWAMESLFINDILEGVNPGYKRRAERRMKKQYGQEPISFGGI